MPTNNYERDFNEQGALKRPGRLDFRLLNNEDDAGDGYPGLQKQIRNLIYQFHNRYVLDGCTYDDVDTLSAGNIIWDNEVIVVSEQTITVNNSEYLYIDSTGTAQTTSTEATAEAGIMIYYRDSGGTGEDIIYKYYQNNLEVYKLKVHKELDMNGDYIVNVGYPTLDEHAANKKYVDDFITSWAIMVDTTDSIQTAIDTIETLGGGYIYLERGTHNEVVDTFPLTINDVSVSIVIFGDGDSTIIDPNGNDVVFSITNSLNCTIRDLKIDSNDFSASGTQAILINETSNNPVTIDNVTIDGDGTNGYGIKSESSNIIIKNCRFSNINTGVYLDTISNNYIYNNNFSEIYLQDIYTWECNNVYINNNIFDSSSANSQLTIYLRGNNFSVTGNYITSHVTSMIVCNTLVNSTINNNIIVDNDSNDATTRGGISLLANCDHNSIHSNIITGNNNIHVSGDTYGIYIVNANCDDNNIFGNIMNGNDFDTVSDSGTNTGFDANGVDLINVGGIINPTSISMNGDIDMNNGNIDDVASIDGGGDAVIFNDDIDISAGNIDDVTSIDGGGDAVIFNDDIDMSAGNIDDVASIDGGGDAVIFNDDIQMASGKDIDVNNNELKNVDILNDYIHYVTTAAELQTTIDNIGTGNGKIIILNDFTLTATIDFDGGGSYKIEGISPDITITSIDDVVFDITVAKESVIKDLTINTVAFTSNINCIHVNETSNNKITFDNITVTGDGTYGYGIELASAYNIIQNCKFKSIAQGVIGAGSYNIITNNILRELSSYAINISGIFVKTIGNWIYDPSYRGIYTSGDFNIINNNQVYNIIQDGVDIFGILVDGDNCIVNNNIIRQMFSNDFDVHGIRISGSYTTCNGNSLNEIQAGAFNNALGIHINSTSTYSTCNGNAIDGVWSITFTTTNWGIYIAGDRTTVNSNNITGVNAGVTGQGYGIGTATGADNNTVVGNTLLGNKSSGILDNGTNTLNANNNTA